MIDGYLDIDAGNMNIGLHQGLIGWMKMTAVKKRKSIRRPLRQRRKGNINAYFVVTIDIKSFNEEKAVL